MTYVRELSRIASGFEVPDPQDAEAETSRFRFSPRIILYPETVEEISEIMRFACANGVRVLPFSGGTKLFLGNPVRAPAAALSLGRLDRVLFHEPSDMVSTVGCGMEIREFQRTVGVHGQVFPVDPPYLDSGATVGGLVSTNLCGPMSTAYGTCRELILGIRAVRADGEIISVGGKVVKNVAGYDIAKFVVGSLGTLCVVAEATFRLYPRRRSSRTLLLGFADAAGCRRAARAVLDADIAPTCFEVLDEGLSAELLPGERAAGAVLLRFDSFERAVGEQVSRVREMMSSEAAVSVEEDDGRSAGIWKRVREFPFDRGEDFSCKITLPIRSSVEVMEDIGGNPALPSGAELRCLSRPARGTLLVSVKAPGRDAIRAARFLENLAASLAGGIMFAGLSPELSESIGAWGDFGDSLGLMRKLKRRFDPGDILHGEKIFNAGSAVG